jgi:hypothetical protein
MKIVHVVRDYDDYFVLKKDSTRTVSISSIQKCIVPTRMLAYGAPEDAKNEYLRIGESNIIESM